MAGDSQKLDFSNLVSLPGRDEQLEILHDAFQNASSSSFVGNNTVKEESAQQQQQQQHHHQQQKKLPSSSSPDEAAAAAAASASSTLSTANRTSTVIRPPSSSGLNIPTAAVPTRAAAVPSPSPPLEEGPREVTRRSSTTGCTIVTVTGASGTGKTALIGEFKKQVQDKCYFCQGNFHKQKLPNSDHRLSAVGDCLFDLMHQIMILYGDDPLLLAAIHAGVSKSEQHILMNAFPGLPRLFLICNNDNNNSSTGERKRRNNEQEGDGNGKTEMMLRRRAAAARTKQEGRTPLGEEASRGSINSSVVQLLPLATGTSSICASNGTNNTIVCPITVSSSSSEVETTTERSDGITGSSSTTSTLTPNLNGAAAVTAAAAAPAPATAGPAAAAAAAPAAAAAAPMTTRLPAAPVRQPQRHLLDSGGAEFGAFGLDRLRLAVRSILRVVATCGGGDDDPLGRHRHRHRPVVWVTEDMQWGETDTLKLLWTLLQDEQLTNFLWIGTYRTNDNECTKKDEPPPHHDTGKDDNCPTFQKRIKLLFHLPEEEEEEEEEMDRLRRDGKNGAMKILVPSALDDRRFYDIHVTNLTSGNIREMLQALLQRHDDDNDETSAEGDDDLSALARAIHQKTAGNAFFVHQFLLTLNRLGLLYYSLSTYRWEWYDVNRISDETAVSDNVVDVVISKIQTLPCPMQVALTVAASLGSTHFDLETLFGIIQASQHAQHLLETVNQQDQDQDQEEQQQPQPQQDQQQVITDDPFKGSIMYHGRDSGSLITNMVQLEELLEDAIVDGLLEKFRRPLSTASMMPCTTTDDDDNKYYCPTSATATAVSSYKFSHDRIHDAAYSLLPKGRARQCLHYSIGKQLLHRLSELNDAERGTAVEDRLVFLAAHQLNLGCSWLIRDKYSRVELAKLNLRAANLALQRTAVLPSLQYLKDAIRLLQYSDGSSSSSLSAAATVNRTNSSTNTNTTNTNKTRSPWEHHYDLMLDLTLKLSQTYLSCGNFVESKNSAQEILIHARSSQDRWAAKYTMISCLAHEGNYQRAYRIIYQVFQELHVYFPAWFVRQHIKYVVSLVRWRLRNRTDDDLLQLATTNMVEFTTTTNDDAAAARMRAAHLFMSQLIHISTLAKDSDIKLLGALRILSWTLDYGAQKSTGPAFATYAHCLQSMGVWDKAFRFGQLAVNIAEQRKAGYRDAVCLLVHYYYIHHWQKPYHESLEPVLTAYHICMQSSNVDFSYVFFAIRAYSQLYLCCGLRLDPLEADMRRFSDMMREFGQSAYAAMYSPWWQLVLNFMGRTKDPEVLTGEAMDQSQLIEEWSQKKNAAVLESISLCQGVLAFHFCNWELAEQIFLDLSNVIEPATALLPHFRLYEALIASSRARSTTTSKVKKYKRKLLSAIRTFDKWVRNGCVNCHHMLLLLKAEQCRLDRPDEAQGAYDAAISAVAKLGFLHHHALANELAGIHFLDVGDHAWASTYLQRARDLYADWGAQAKVLHMEGKYGSSLRGAGPVLRKAHMGVKARTRLDVLSPSYRGNPDSLMTSSLIRLAKRRMSE